MSLINDALRDLDLREQNACVAAKESLYTEGSSLDNGAFIEKNFVKIARDQLNGNMDGVDASARREKYCLYGIIAILILLCGGYVLLHQNIRSSSHKDRESVVLIDAVPKISEISERAEGKYKKSHPEDGGGKILDRPALPHVSAEQKYIVEGAVNNQPSLRGLISQNLEKASRSITQNRLSVPVNNNAIYFLNEVLKLDPANEHAMEELKNITGLYIQQIDYALEQKNIARAKTLVSRYEKFGLKPSAREGYLAEIKNVDREAKTVLNMAVTYQKSNSEIKQNKSKDSTWVKVTSESEDLQKVATAKEHLYLGDSQGAIRLLEDYITVQPLAINSSIFLFDFYAGNSDHSKAQSILSTLPEAHVARTYFEAKIASHSLGEQNAIAILESSRPNEKMKEKQGAYLAALYQKEKRYQEAQNVYAELLRIDENNPRYLLGFAVAADARGESFSSLRAYKKLLFIGHSSEKVASFVKKRVKILSASSQKEVSVW